MGGEAAGAFAALRVADYPRLWLSGWLWNVTRWIAVFLCSYLINQLTGSPLLVQLVGAAFYTPILFGSILGGVVSDRFDRRRTLLVQLGGLAPIAAAMGAVALTGHLRAWMVYPFMLAVGAGWVVDMTSRRALIYDMVGGGGITNAMALESMSMTGGAMLGNLAGGAVLAVGGAWQAFVLVAVLYAAAWLCVLGVRTPPGEHVHMPGGSVRADIAAGLRYVRGHRMLLLILGVTVLVNLCYYPYQPLVPVFADRLHVDAFRAGVLAAAAGLGSLGAAMALALGWRPGRGWTFIAGGALAMAGVLVFATSRWYPLSLLGLMLAGAGQAGYSAMQGALPLSVASAEMRGRAVGVITMGIGVLPISMAAVGLAAQAVGPVLALAGTAALGLAGLAVWAIKARELRGLT